MSNEIESLMLSLRNEEQSVGLMRFFKTGKGEYGEGDKFLGIKVPQTRAVVKAYWKKCCLNDLEPLIASPYHEIRLCALLILVQIFKHARKDAVLQEKCVDFYLSHTQFINNWDLVDLSCYEILGTWLLDKDRQMLYDLARNGKTIWEQRIAMVSCMQFVRHGELDDCIRIADILLMHTHDLIRKSVGWLLREVGKRDENLLKDYLNRHYKTMPRITLRYTIEHFPKDVQQSYKVVRL
ncbi:MAG: DNA alkylation repair protein [Prevotellaceae bacterium]|nr:DNA alkylation repair protein [Prevotellaceae bacterium]